MCHKCESPRETLREKAIRKSLENGYGYSIVELDKEPDQREVVLVLTSYTYTDEFEAFNGEVLADFEHGEEIF